MKSRVRNDRDDSALIAWADAGALLVYGLLSALIVLGRTKGWRVDLIHSDAAAYAASVAAQLQPERFKGDLLLENLADLKFAGSFLTFYLRHTADWLGGFGNANAALLGPTTFLQLAGYHFLAKRVLQRSDLAFLYALISALNVQIGISGEYWGIFQDPLSRSMYQALFPFLLLLAISGFRDERFRWAAMVAAGALVYIHPHSAVTQAFALLCGFVALKPTQVAWPRHLALHVILGFAFLAVALPYILNFLGSTAVAEIRDPALALEISRTRMPAYNAPYRLVLGFLAWCWPYLLAMLFGLIWLWRRRPDQHDFLRFVAGWCGGLLVISVIVPITEHAITSALGRLPFEYDLVRSLRYVIPIGWLFVFLIAQELFRRDAGRLTHAGRAVAGLVLAAFAYGFVKTGPEIPWMVRTGVECLRAGEFPCALTQYERDTRALLAAVSALPPASPIFVEDQTQGLAIRQAARQPVVYTEKEGAWLLYAGDFDGMVKWYDRFKAFSKLQTFWSQSWSPSSPLTNEEEWHRVLLGLARSFGADYVVIARDAKSLKSMASEDILLATQNASLLRLPPENNERQPR